MTREVKIPETLFGEKCQGPDHKTEKCLPDIVTFADPVEDSFSVDYFKMPGVNHNMMPVWEQASRNVFLFYDKDKTWVIGRDYDNNSSSWKVVIDGESGLAQLPLRTYWHEWHDHGVKLKVARAELRLITRDQAQGHPWVTCGGKEASSCLDCGSICDTDCFTWSQKWSLQKPCVSKRRKCHLCNFFKK